MDITKVKDNDTLDRINSISVVNNSITILKDILNPPNSNNIEYIKFSDIRPLDIGFIGGSDVISLFIRSVEKIGIGEGKFSHMFIVISTDILHLDNMIPNRLYLLEVTLSGRLNDGIKDINGRTHFGVQVRDLEDVCKAQICMKSKLYFSKLKNNPFREGFNVPNTPFSSNTDILKYKDILRHKMFSVYSEYINEGYNFNPKALLKPVFNWINSSKDNNGVFCSEFVAIVYNRLQISSISDPQLIAPVSIINEKDITGIRNYFNYPLALFYTVV